MPGTGELYFPCVQGTAEWNSNMAASAALVVRPPGLGMYCDACSTRHMQGKVRRFRKKKFRINAKRVQFD